MRSNKLGKALGKALTAYFKKTNDNNNNKSDDFLINVFYSLKDVVISFIVPIVSILIIVILSVQLILKVLYYIIPQKYIPSSSLLQTLINKNNPNYFKSSYSKYQYGKELYSKGRINDAIVIWNSLQCKKYYKSYLSLVCHELYTTKNYTNAIQIVNQLLNLISKQKLKNHYQFQQQLQLQTQQVIQTNNSTTITTTTTNNNNTNNTNNNDSYQKQLQKWKTIENEIETLKLDIEALQNNDTIMIEMNIQMSKLEYLGIGSTIESTISKTNKAITKQTRKKYF